MPVHSTHVGPIDIPISPLRVCAPWTLQHIVSAVRADGATEEAGEAVDVRVELITSWAAILVEACWVRTRCALVAAPVPAGIQCDARLS